MVDKILTKFDTKTQEGIPVLYVDNGDGTYSEKVSIAGEVGVEIGEETLTVEGDVNASETWRVSLQPEETANNSDKTFTVPASTEWQILDIWIEFASTATVGNRQIVVERQDAENDVCGQFKAGSTQPASQNYNYMFAPGQELMPSAIGNYLTFPLPSLFLPPGFKLRIYDSAAIAPTADDMVVQMMIAARTV